MKYTLYLDSSYYLTMGLFNEEGPLFFQTWTAPRASGAIHKELDQLLKNYSLDFSAIEKVVYAAGPGLYTGMRIASGLAQCFELLKIPVLSFYHFQVPFLLGVEKGVWFSGAFKGEIFCYSWDGKESKQILIKASELANTLLSFEQQGYQHFFSYFDTPEQHKEFIPPHIVVSDSAKLIYEKALFLFAQMEVKKEFCPPFYYRALEEEFKTT